MLKKLLKKNYISRKDPDFIVSSLVSKKDFQISETNNLINSLFEGSKKIFFSAFLNQENLNEKEIQDILTIIGQNDE